MIRDGQGLRLFIEFDHDRQVAQFAFELADRGEGFEFLRRIDRIRDQLAQENVVIGIEKFFDDRKDVFRCNAYFTVLHSCMIDRFCRTVWRERYEQKICHPGRPDILTEKRRTVNQQACQSTVRMGD